MLLLVRLRAALLPEYDVERELAHGGMGIVFLARDVALNRPVAVKILRPELATADAAESFVYEAQTAAKLRHPNIVPVHFAGERDGLSFYVMDYIEAPTLAERLEEGSLPPSGVVKLGRDLLDALEHAHGLPVIHRDIKPSNVFMARDRALLGDFGIAKVATERMAVGASRASEGASPAFTAPGVVKGTHGYMPPEQAVGGIVTPRTDLYAVAMVLYEALTSRRWPVFEADTASWSGVPRRIARVLRRALEFDPARRWQDAAAFRRALWHTRVRTYQWRAFALTVGGLVTGALLTAFAQRQQMRAGPVLQVQLEPFETGDGAPDRIADSVDRALRASLSRYPDVAVRAAPWWWPFRRGVALEGTLAVASDSLHVTVRAVTQRRVVVEGRGTLSGVRFLADSIADELYAQLGATPLDSALLAGVRPTTPAASSEFRRADQLFAQARWGEAYVAYGSAAAADSACWLCYWRQAEVGRWLGLAHDRSTMDPYLKHIDAFPPPYQSLIRADTMPLVARLAALERVTRTWPDFLFGQFRRAEELMHRGPLVGHARAEAIGPYEEVLRLRPRFGPAWEHLAWIHIADGDSADAATALAQYRASSESSDVFTVGMRALLTLGFAWRFQAEQQAKALLDSLPGRVEAAGFQDIDAGARFLPYFRDSRGAIEFGRTLEDWPRFRRSGLLAQAFGYLGVGRPDSARAVFQRLADRYADPGLGLFLAELDATTLFLDEDSAAGAARWPGVRTALEGYASLRAGPLELRQRAAWMLSLVAFRFGPHTDVAFHRALLAGEAGPQPLTTLLRAVASASAGGYARALELSDPLTSLEPGRGEVPDPYFLTLLHVLRAGWSAHQAGGVANARRELLWHEHSDLHRYPTGEPQPAELDWSFAPLAEQLIRATERGP